MTDRAALVAALRAAEGRLAGTVAGIPDADLRPSRLPGWTVAHVLAHLAANADSVTRRLRGMLADVVVDQYPGGRTGREAEIEQRAGQPAPVLREDLDAAVNTLFEMIAEVPDPLWSRLSRTVGGRETDGDAMLAGRWQEVEIHHADLGLDYTAADWPDDFVADRLPALLPSVLDRGDHRALLAWVTGRGPVPDLSPW